MTGWFGRLLRGNTGRIAAVERELDAMRAAIARPAPLEAEQAPQMAQSLIELGGRLLRLESRVDIDQGQLRGVTDEAARLATQLKTDHEELIKLRTAVQRVERELQLGSEQAREAVAGLLQRIESLKLAQKRSPQPVGPGPVRGVAEPRIEELARRGDDRADAHPEAPLSNTDRSVR